MVLQLTQVQEISLLEEELHHTVDLSTTVVTLATQAHTATVQTVLHIHLVGIRMLATGLRAIRQITHRMLRFQIHQLSLMETVGRLI